MSNPNSKLGSIHWNGLEGVDLGHLALPRKRCCSRRRNKAKDGWREKEGGGGIVCKNKKSQMRKQTSAGCPRALGLEADALSSARPVRTLPWACRINRVARFFSPFSRNTLQPDPTYALTAGSAEGEMRPFTEGISDLCEFFSRSGRESV